MIVTRSAHLLAAVSSLAFVGIAAVPAAAAPTGFGSAAFQSARYCRTEGGGGGSVLAAGVNCMAGFNPRIQTVQTGGDGVAVNSAFTTDIGGRLESRVLFGELDLPVIKSGAWADDDTRVASTIVTYMGFSFGGTEETLYALDAVIDWTSSGAPLGLADIASDPAAPAGEYGGEGMGNLQLYLWDAAYVPVFGSPGSITGFLPFPACGTAGVLAYSAVNMATAAAGPGEVTSTLNTGCGGGSIMLQPGKSYVLFAQLQTVANRNGFMDATNTITVQLAEELPPEVRDTLFENIVSARSLVPEPASWAMLITGFGLVGATMRRRRAALA
jgi:hypothetical protein